WRRPARRRLALRLLGLCRLLAVGRGWLLVGVVVSLSLGRHCSFLEYRGCTSAQTHTERTTLSKSLCVSLGQPLTGPAGDGLQASHHLSVGPPRRAYHAQNTADATGRSVCGQHESAGSELGRLVLGADDDLGVGLTDQILEQRSQVPRLLQHLQHLVKTRDFGEL